MGEIYSGNNASLPELLEEAGLRGGCPEPVPHLVLNPDKTSEPSHPIEMGGIDGSNAQTEEGEIYKIEFSLKDVRFNTHNWSDTFVSLVQGQTWGYFNNPQNNPGGVSIRPTPMAIKRWLDVTHHALNTARLSQSPAETERIISAHSLIPYDGHTFQGMNDSITYYIDNRFYAQYQQARSLGARFEEQIQLLQGLRRGEEPDSICQELRDLSQEQRDLLTNEELPIKAVVEDIPLEDRLRLAELYLGLDETNQETFEQMQEYATSLRAAELSGEAWLSNVWNGETTDPIPLENLDDESKTYLAQQLSLHVGFEVRPDRLRDGLDALAKLWGIENSDPASLDPATVKQLEIVTHWMAGILDGLFPPYPDESDVLGEEEEYYAAQREFHSEFLKLCDSVYGVGILSGIASGMTPAGEIASLTYTTAHADDEARQIKEDVDSGHRGRAALGVLGVLALIVGGGAAFRALRRRNPVQDVQDVIEQAPEILATVTGNSAPGRELRGVVEGIQDQGARLRSQRRAPDGSPKLGRREDRMGEYRASREGPPGEDSNPGASVETKPEALVQRKKPRNPKINYSQLVDEYSQLDNREVFRRLSEGENGLSFSSRVSLNGFQNGVRNNIIENLLRLKLEHKTLFGLGRMRKLKTSGRFFKIDCAAYHRMIVEKIKSGSQTRFEVKFIGTHEAYNSVIGNYIGK